MTKRVDAVVAAIRPILADLDPAIHGAALGELVAIFITRHYGSDLREEALQTHITLVRGLIE